MGWKVTYAAARAISISSNRSAGPQKRWEAKMVPASFGYFAAHSVEEALQLLTKHGEDAKLLAGGHSLIPAMKLRLAAPRTLIDIGSVSGLRDIRLDGEALAIGALTVHAEILSSDLVRRYCQGLA